VATRHEDRGRGHLLSSVSPQELVKTLIFKTDTEVVAALIRGDHEVNEVKLKNLLRAIRGVG